MKRAIILFLLFITAKILSAQGLGNFFSQKDADIKYMLAQIADLEIYISDVEKGYNIAQKGLSAIDELKTGEFNLHAEFFSSLKMVSPSVSDYAKVAGIASVEISIIGKFKKLLNIKNLSAAELKYVTLVYSSMADGCAKQMDALIQVLTYNDFGMTDDQRIKQVDRIYDDIKDKYAFTQSFSNSTFLLAAQRQNELNEVNVFKNCYP